ncbi:MAG: hypothetical protein ABI182_01410, partial [Candidatus Baltobacteraceae bacterium]
GVRNDYANPSFVHVMNAGMRDFYARKFAAAESDFELALRLIPDNTLAMSFEDAAATYLPGELDRLADQAVHAAGLHPRRYDLRVRLGFIDLFESLRGLDDSSNAQAQWGLADRIQPGGAAAHVGSGILDLRRQNLSRAKRQFLTALQADPNDALANEYLSAIYQTDLKEPLPALRYALTVVDLVPQYADIRFHAGSILNDVHQPSEAVKYVTQALELDTGRVGEAGQYGLTLLAGIYIAQHKLNDAKRVLSAAVHENLDAGYASTLLAKISKGDYNH